MSCSCFNTGLVCAYRRPGKTYCILYTFAESLSTANNNTTFSLQRGTRVNDVILPINVFDVFGLLA